MSRTSDLIGSCGLGLKERGRDRNMIDRETNRAGGSSKETALRLVAINYREPSKFVLSADRQKTARPRSLFIDPTTRTTHAIIMPIIMAIPSDICVS